MIGIGIPIRLQLKPLKSMVETELVELASELSCLNSALVLESITFFAASAKLTRYGRPNLVKLVEFN